MTASQRYAPLLAALSRAAERRLGEFSPLDLANTTWAFATTAQWDAALFAALARAAERCPGEFSQQQFANAARAFATAAQWDSALLAALARAAEWRLGESTRINSPTQRGRLRRHPNEIQRSLCR